VPHVELSLSEVADLGATRPGSLDRWASVVATATEPCLVLDAAGTVIADKIPPLLAIASGGLARGLLRVRDEAGASRTVDAVSSALCDGSSVVGSITYFAPVNPVSRVGHASQSPG